MHLLHRRKFLNESALLAAAAATTSGLNHRLSADEAAKAAEKGPASERLRVAVVGVRGQGMSHVRGYANRHNCEITTICDVDAAVIGPAMKHVTKEQGKEPKYERDVRRVVEDPNIDVISTATPNHWHALIAIWAMQHGKHVYVEKPVSHEVLEGRRMVEASRRYNKICQTGTQSRSTKGMREAIAYLHSGKLGTVKLARGLCYKLRPSIGKVDGPQEPPKTMDYNLWCGPAPFKKPHRKTKNGTVHYDWHWIWDYGNGDLGNQGIHEMDKARWGLNKNFLPLAAMSIGGRFGYVDDGETPNSQVIFFDYGDCELVFEVRGWPSDSPYPGKESPKRGKKPGNFVGNIWYGSEGFLVCPSYNGGVAYSNDGEILQRFSGGGDHFGNFIKAVRSGKREDLNADVLEGHLSSALCHLGNISHRLGTLETFDKTPRAFGVKAADDAMASLVEHLKQNKISTDGLQYHLGRKLNVKQKSETFADDKEANALRTRDYRAGFVVPDKV
jgi:predicted dehydrogenase